MTLLDLATKFFDGISVYGWFGIVIALLSVVQISPIKIAPLSWLAKKVGNACNRETNDTVKRLTTELAETKKIVADLTSALTEVKRICEENDTKAARERILWFGDELVYQPEKKHSKDRWDSVVQYINDYDDYSDKHPEFKNHITDSTTKMIMESYMRCMRERDFL